jgi:hypothetical protein
MWVGQEPLDVKVVDISIPANHAALAAHTTPASLHVVRYERKYSFSVVEEEGFRVRDFVYGQDADGQSSLYLVRLGS